MDKVTLATVATSGSYNDLTNKPTIPAAVTVDSALSSTSTNPVQNKIINTALNGKMDKVTLATVATSGSYNDLTNKPTISNYYHTPTYSSGLSIATGTGVNALYVPIASTSAGVVCGFHRTSGAASGTKTTNASNNPAVNSRTTTYGRYYGVETDKNGYMFVNVPWDGEANVQSDWDVTDTTSDAYIKNKPTIPAAVTSTTVTNWGFTKNAGTVTRVTIGTGLTTGTLYDYITSSGTISLKVASSTEIGGIQLGYTTSGKNYPVKLADNKAYVNVPWTDTDTKVTSAANHYTPEENTSAAITATGGTATDITGTSGKLNVVTGLKRDAKGHVVGVTCANIYSTDNASGGSDTKVTQTVTTSNANYPILLAPSSQTTTTTGTAYFETAIKINPSTRKITGVDYIYPDSSDLTLQSDDWVVIDASNLLPETSAESDLGSPTRLWNNVYATTIYEGGTALSSKYQAKGTYATSDTKNTAGSTNTTSKIYLIGATSQAANPQTYSHKTVYVETVSSTSHLVSTGGFYESSDERLKDFGEGLRVDLDALSKLRKSYFTFKDKPENPQIGVSAQEIQKLYPEVVIETSDGHLNVDYAKLSVIALAAIDQLNDKVKSLEDRLARLEKLLENK